MNSVRAISVVAAILVMFCGYTVSAQSNQGKEFWTGYMSHIESTGKSQMSLYITGGVNTKGTVDIADGSYSIPFTVTANQVTIVSIPRSAFMKDQGQYLKGIHLTSEKNVAVYAHIYASSVSGATLLLPVNGLGKNYYSINYTQSSNSDSGNLHSYSSFMVVATEDNTVVEIIPSADLLNGIKAKTVLTLNLKKGEVYQGLSLTDLTNTVIRSKNTGNSECKKIAVFSGSTKIGIGCKEAGFTSDNLFQQVYPTASWGKHYISAPLKSRDYDMIRVVSGPNAATVTVNGIISYLPAAGFVDVALAPGETSIVNSDQPVQVVQYSVSQGQTYNSCVTKKSDVGDPEMIYLTPTELTLDHVTLYSSPDYEITSHYINVIIKASQKSTFTIDGRPYEDFFPVLGDDSYVYAQIEVSAGTHNIRAAEGFNAIAYGFGNAESYGYAAGANLKNLNQFIDLQDQQNAQAAGKVNGCRDIEYKLHLTLPYPTANIEWDFKDGTPNYIESNPKVAYTTLKPDGKILYNYNFPNPLKFSPGDYSITATVLNITNDICGSTTDINFDFNIADYPEPKFTYESNCPGEETSFLDKTDAKGSELKTWLWDFGDGETSTLQNPKHVFAKAGTYNVVLTANNINDCASVSAAVKVIIAPRPIVAFTTGIPNCVGKEILFTDKSTSAGGKIIKRLWDFGDGTIASPLDNKPFTHVFAEAKTYTVKLILWDDKGCSEALDKVTNINPLPNVNFKLPDACVSDEAVFTNTSTIADNTEVGFTYRWDFGDALATAAHPNISTLKNGRHRYARFGVYTVTLTVTSANGCTFSKSQQFTVNGGEPVAKFTAENKDKLCSNNAVVFNETSTVDFGGITKIVWYYDYDGNRGDTETFTRDMFPAGRKYMHSYPVFNSPATKTFKVHMEAYSGDSCWQLDEQTITLKASPIIQFPEIGALCQEDLPIRIVPQTNGFIGTGAFTGKGINEAGLFNPALAGPGTFTITYTFVAQNGCDFTATTSITVNATPKVDAGGSTGLLEGETTLLKASASGKGLIYKWTPATGLDHDDVLNPVTSAMDNTIYKLTVTSANGCTAESEILVRVLKKLSLINTFTPNGDGVNDTWVIKYLETYPGNTVDVYNRYGEKVYSSVGYRVPWDGTYKGTNLPEGTYYYIINPKNGRKTVSGSVTIIR